MRDTTANGDLKPGQEIYLMLPVGFVPSYSARVNGRPKGDLFTTYKAAAMSFGFSDDELAAIRRDMEDHRPIIAPIDTEDLSAYRRLYPADGVPAFAGKH